VREDPMPQYVFFCESCQKEFTISLHISEMEKGVVKCPKCGAEKVRQMVAAFSAVTSRKS
jgi:putative FmdB family regulatory protein